MELIQNQVFKIFSGIQEIVQVITSLFECIKQKNNDTISDIKDLREETYDLTSDLKMYIFQFYRKKLTV